MNSMSLHTLVRAPANRGSGGNLLEVDDSVLEEDDELEEEVELEETVVLETAADGDTYRRGATGSPISRLEFKGPYPCSIPARLMALTPPYKFPLGMGLSRVETRRQVFAPWYSGTYHSTALQSPPSFATQISIQAAKLGATSSL
jgi:hypothetical protein